MTAAERRELAADRGYQVWPSDWEDSAGGKGRSWVISRPDGTNLDEYEGSEASAWRSAYRDMRSHFVA